MADEPLFEKGPRRSRPAVVGERERFPFAGHPRGDDVDRLGPETVAPSECEQDSAVPLFGEGHVEEGVVLLGELGEPFDGGRVEHRKVSVYPSRQEVKSDLATLGPPLARHGPTKMAGLTRLLSRSRSGAAGVPPC